MDIRKSNGPKIEPCRTPASTNESLESIKKLLSRRFPEIPICLSLNSKPSRHTLSKAFEISKKLALTSRVDIDQN